MWPSSTVWLAFLVCSLSSSFSGKCIKYDKLVINVRVEYYVRELGYSVRIRKVQEGGWFD